MGFKYTEIETIGDLRIALKDIANDVPLRVMVEDLEYSKLSVQSINDKQEDWYVKFEPEGMV